MAEIPRPQIKDNIPVPPKMKGRPRSSKWTFLYEMEIGQSAHFDFDDHNVLKKFRSQLFSKITRYQKASDKKFTVRTQDNEVGVWREE